MDKEQLRREGQELRSRERAVDPAQFKKSFLDIQYAADSPEQVLDVFLPEAEGVWPLVVFVHGGGWYFGGRREECISSIFKLVSQGYAIATIDYRLVPDAVFPEQLHDVKAAIRYLRAHSEELHLNTEKIVIWGNSAGAHLAALAAARNVPSELENLSMGNADYSSQIDGLLAWYGVYNLNTQRLQMKELFPDRDPAENDASTAMLGEDDPERRKTASPITYVTAAYPPTLLQQGTNDVLVPYLQAIEFRDRISAFCGMERVRLDLFPGAGHGAAEIKADANLLRCLHFLDSIYYPDGSCPYPRGPLPELQYVASSCTKIDPYEGV